jgi:superfamily I DNA and/or RNA helicase
MNWLSAIEPCFDSKKRYEKCHP